MKISELPVASSTNSGDLLAILQSGTTKQVTLANILSGYQATNAQVTAIGALATTGIVERTGANTFATFSVSSTGKTLVGGANAAAMRTTLGLGTLATQDGTFSGTHSGTSSGTNTGDQTNITGNAATATKLATARTINGVSFDGTANITIAATAAASALTGTTIASNVTASSLLSAAGGTFGTAAFTAASAYALVDHTHPFSGDAHASTHHYLSGSDPITAASVGAAAASHTHEWSTITGNGPLTIGGYAQTFPLMAGNIGFQDGTVGVTSTTVDLTKPTPLHTITLSADRTIAFAGGNAGRRFRLVVAQNSTGGYSITWPTVKWPLNTPPTQTTTANHVDLYEFHLIGPYWYGIQIAKDFTL